MNPALQKAIDAFDKANEAVFKELNKLPKTGKDCKCKEPEDCILDYPNDFGYLCFKCGGQI